MINRTRPKKRKPVTRPKLTQLELLSERVRLESWLASHDETDRKFLSVKLSLFQVNEELEERDRLTRRQVCRIGGEA